MRLHQAIGLSAPDQHWEAFKTQQHKSVAQLKSDIRPWTGRSYQAHHKQYLPYAVLCFGQSRAFVASITGTTDSPVWAQDAVVWKFDMIRASQLSVRLYLKSPETNQRDTDIPIGVVTMDPLFEERGSAGVTEWLHVEGGGTGQIRIGVSYDKKPLAQMGSVEEAYCSYGLHSPVTTLRKQDTQQLYALKSMKPELIGAAPTAPSSLRFQIDSPFIAPLAYACQPQRELHLLLPFVSGEHLFYRLQRDRMFDTDQSRFYAAEIFCALKHLHKFDIVYEGLRPKHILINSLGHITIVDHHLFLSDRVTEARAVDGASWYPAPKCFLVKLTTSRQTGGGLGTFSTKCSPACPHSTARTMIKPFAIFLWGLLIFRAHFPHLPGTCFQCSFITIRGSDLVQMGLPRSRLTRFSTASIGRSLKEVNMSHISNLAALQ